MKKYNFYIDELRPIWWRYFVEVDAENEQEALEKAKNLDCDILDSDMLDTAEYSNKIEIMDSNLNTLYSNICDK